MKKTFLILNLILSVLFCYSQDYQTFINEANNAYMMKDYEKAVKCFQQALDLQGDIPFYNAACVAALAGKTDLAFAWLGKAFDKGFYDARQLQKDNDLVSLHNNPQWKILVEKMQQKLDEIEKNYDKPLMERMLHIFDDDQEIRQKYIFAINEFGHQHPKVDSLLQIMRVNDSINLQKITEILDKYGWVGASKVGQQANTAFWVVIQHADLKTQKKYLPMLRQAVKNKNASAEHLAMLEDRVLIGEGKKQIYGSQLQWSEKENRNVLFPLKDPDNVDKRRAKVGLPPLVDYLKNWGIEWNLKEYKKSIQKK